MASKLAIIITALLLSSAGAHADLSISNKLTKNMSCNAGVCTATAKGANLNTGDLTAMLASGDTTVITGGGAITIQVLDGFSWTSASRLTLDADHSVGFHGPVVAAGSGAITINYNDNGGSEGALLFFDTGKIDFGQKSSQLLINGTAYKLVADLKVLAKRISGNPSGNFALAQDFNALVDGVFLQSVITTPFGGSLEGLGHTIDHLSISDSNSNDQLVALFSWLDVGSRVADLHLTNASVTSVAAGATAGLAAVGLGTIDHVQVDGSVNGGWYTAGIVGQNKGSIFRAISAVTLSSVICGGITGFNDGGVISFSVASGSMSCEDAGGLVGANQGRIAMSSASASVSSDYDHAIIGGLVGQHFGVGHAIIDQSFATGTVSQKSPSKRHSDRRFHPAKGFGAMAGGLVGFSSARITNSYASGSATVLHVSGAGMSAAGGLIGYSTSGTFGAYSTGAVTPESHSYIGGSIGYDATPDNIWLYWDIDMSDVRDKSKGAGNIAFDPGLKGVTDKHLKSALPKGLDSNIWGQSLGINNGYPYLLANPPPK